VALSRLSNHPVSRAMVESAPHMDGDVAVLSFEQVCDWVCVTWVCVLRVCDWGVTHGCESAVFAGLVFSFVGGCLRRGRRRVCVHTPAPAAFAVQCCAPMPP
jgi:hypothetical protein